MKFFFLLMAAWLQVHGYAQESSIIITDSENDLIPEGIAVDTGTKTIYISSIARHKIIAVDKNGKQRDFINYGQDNFLEGLGMKIDYKRKWLWVVSDKRDGKWFTSQVHAFDLKSGKKQQFYSLKDTIPHLFNDLDIANDGKIYLTDTYYSAIYLVDPEKEQLDLFLKSKKLDYPNGITFGNRGQLFVATYANGPVTIDLSTKSITQLKGYKDSAMAHGLDGFVYSNHTLTGIYNIGNDPSKNAVIQYSLSKDGKSIIGEKIIDKGHKVFHEPTTLAIADHKIYVLANSHLSVYNANKESTKGKEHLLTPVAIVIYPAN